MSSKRELSLEGNELKDIIDIIKAENKIKTYSELAELLNINVSTFRNRLHRDNMNFNDAVKLADFLGYEIVFRKK